MNCNAGFASEEERLDFLMSMNEVYFGRTDSINAIEDQLRKFRHKYINTKRKPTGDKDLIKLNHMIAEQFGFGKFELLITFDPIPNAATIPIEYSFDASKKQNNYMVDISSYKFKKEYDYKCIVVMTTGLIFNDYFSTEEIMACLLYELGRNFYVCFSDNNAILSNIHMAGNIALLISNVVSEFMFTKKITDFVAGKAGNATMDAHMSVLKDPEFAILATDPDVLASFTAHGEQKAQAAEARYKVYGTAYNILHSISTLFVNSPIYRKLQSQMQKNYHNHKPTKRAMYDFCDYLKVALGFVGKGFDRVMSSLKFDNNAGSILQQLDIINLIIPYKQFIAMAINPLTYITMPANYKVERAASNFPTMYGYGAAEASYIGKMQCNDKIKLVNHFLKKNPGISILFDAITLPSKIMNGVFDPSPSGISKCYDQLKMLKYELAKEDLSQEMKEILIRDISELEKQIKQLMITTNGVHDPNICKHLYNKALGDILNGVGLKDRIFDDKNKFKKYDSNFNSKVQSESAIGWSCNDEEILSEGIISDAINKHSALSDIKQQYQEAMDKFVTHNWIKRYITAEQEEMLKKYYDNLVKEDVSYSDYKKAFNFICKFMGIDNGCMIEHLEFKNDKKDKDSRICSLCYSKGTIKIKIPEGLSLIHVSPVEGITALNPTFRNKKLGHFMYPSKRVFFTIEKDIKAKNASLSGQKLHRYRAKNIQYAYIDPTCNTFSDRAVYIETDTPIPVEPYDKFLEKLFKNVKGLFSDSFTQESFEYDNNLDSVSEMSFEDLMNNIKNWKTHNQGKPRPEFVSNTVTDEEYAMLEELIKHMYNDESYTDYKKAFDKFCKYCHIVPRGTIIYSHELKKGKEPDHNHIRVVYAYNIKKIDIPEGTVLYHMSKVEGIKELNPFFRGKSARGFLYDKPRVYLTLNKNMIRLFADYKPTEKIHKYVVTQPIKNAFIDPLVPDIINRAIYVETNKPIPVMPLEEYVKTHDVQKEALIDFAMEYGLEIVE